MVMSNIDQLFVPPSVQPGETELRWVWRSVRGLGGGGGGIDAGEGVEGSIQAKGRGGSFSFTTTHIVNSRVQVFL